MNGFLVIAQYTMDDIPLRLLPTRAEAMTTVAFYQRLHPDRLHEFAQESMKTIGRDASMQIDEAELALTEFKDGKVVEHEIFGLTERADRNSSAPSEG